MYFAFWGSLVIGGVVAYFSEKWDFTHHGYVQAIVIAIGRRYRAWLLRIWPGRSTRG